MHDDSPLLDGYPKTEMNESIIFQSITLALSLVVTVIVAYLMIRIGAQNRQESGDHDDPELDRARQ